MTKILLTNDDGVHAQGIHILYEYLDEIYDVTLVAPDRNCSGASSALTLMNPLRVTRHNNGYLSVNGTPSDSTHLAVTQLMKPRPDIVVAGINHGANLGNDTIYSGTVAAAIAGQQLGIPAIAVSIVSKQPKHLETAAHVTALIIEQLLSMPLPSEKIININVPDIPLSQLNGIQVTRLGCRKNPEGMKKMQDPWMRDIYWYGKLSHAQDAEEGTDFYAIKQGYASVTPLSVDMTAHDKIKQMTKWVNELTL